MRRPPLAVVLAACAVAGAALGAGATSALRSDGGEAPAPIPVVGRLPASVLERPQRPAELVGVPDTPGIRRATLRRIGPLGGDSALLVGLDTAGDRCIVAVTPASGLFRAGCVPAAGFASGGARVAWSVEGGTRHLAAEWAPDGVVRAGAVPETQ